MSRTGDATHASHLKFWPWLALSAAAHLALLGGGWLALGRTPDWKPEFHAATGMQRAFSARVTSPRSESPQQLSEEEQGDAEEDAGREPGRFTSDAIREETRAIFESIRYPRLARQRGWQGRVGVQADIRSDGSVASARVIQSSGYGVLDEAALRGVRAHRFRSGAEREQATFYFRFKLR